MEKYLDEGVVWVAGLEVTFQCCFWSSQFWKHIWNGSAKCSAFSIFCLLGSGGRIIEVFMTYKVHSSLNVPPFSLNNWRFCCGRVTTLHTVPEFTVCYISIHLHLTALCLEVFRRLGAEMGFMFHSPRSGCWVKQWALVLQELKQWPDVNHVFCSLGPVLCVGGSRVPWGLEPCSQNSQPSCSTLLGSWRQNFCCLDGPEGAVTRCLSLSLRSGSRFQNKLEMDIAGDKGFSWEWPKSFGWSLESKNSNADGEGYS